MEHFIYVFSIKDKDTLMSSGFNLLKSDQKKHIYVFENNRSLKFSKQDIEAIYSDIMMVGSKGSSRIAQGTPF